MSETYAEQLDRVRELIALYAPSKDSLAIAAVLERLDELQKHADEIVCVWCGHKTMRGGLTAAESGEAVRQHVIQCKKRPEVQLTRSLYSIITALGVDLEILPANDISAFLEDAERAMQARELKAFVRGMRAANVANGKDADALPEEIQPGLEK